ncbi:MAG TPA: 30S ribosomal protein S16 [bacterium]|nr:30S ribosomal protein S16 [bacterium]HSA34779.1 30S ribosomal protein S16 [bacterium]
MSVSIRLSRLGGKKKPFYRIIAVDKRKKRDGDCLERLGHYDPTRTPVEIVMDVEKINRWIANGAQCSETVASLMKKVAAKAKKAEA